MSGYISIRKGGDGKVLTSLFLFYLDTSSYACVIPVFLYQALIKSEEEYLAYLTLAAKREKTR